MHRHALALFVLLAGHAAAQSPAPTVPARGVVFADADGNGRRDAGEKGLPDVRVSNGRDIVLTDAQGRYELPVDEDDIVFVIKPRGWMTPVDENNLPRFYYIHKPAGSPAELRFRGVAPTGPLPGSIDFPLTPQTEPERFRAVIFGDTQPRNVQEVEYLAHDVVEELVGVDAAFGVTLGDIVFDDLSVFEPYVETVGLIGLPWYNVLGNHDQNYDVLSDDLSDEAYERVFGPATYSFDYGPVHYVVLDNVVFYRNGEDKPAYRGGLTEEQMSFIVSDLARVPKDTLIVFMMHIPLWEVPEKARLFELIKEYPHALSMSAHTHWTEHVFMGEEHGNPADHPHHHYVAVTACGSWWQGAPDERGIPHATMSDGGPNGYTIVTFDGSGYSMEVKAASRPADDQMRIWAPEEVSTGELGATEVVVNVYGGSSRSTVEMRIGGGEWRPMRQDPREDPYFLAMKRLEESETPPPGRKLPKPRKTTHIWAATLPETLAPGGHLIEIRTTDMFGSTYHAERVIRVR